MKLKISVRGIVVNKEGRLLSVRLKPYTGSARLEGEWWCTPGGGLDAGEPLIAGLEREMLEETGIKPDIGNLLYIQQFNSSENEVLDFFFHIKNFEDYTNINLSKTTHGDTEIEEIRFIDPKSKTIKPDFLSTQNLLSDISGGRVQVFDNLSL